MATNFPTSLDTLTNPTGTDTLASPDHAGQHADANDAIEALQAKVGVDGSAVTTSLDYKVAQLSIPSGVMQMFAGSTAPSGWLVCDGSAVSRFTYSALFAVIGTTFGAGNGSTTFNVPDLRSRAPMGAGTGTGLTARTLGGQVGAEAVTIGSGNLPTHQHAIDHDHGSVTSSNDIGDHTHGVDPPATASGGISANHQHYTGGHSHNYNFSTDAAGGTARARLTNAGGGTGSGGILSSDAGWSGFVSSDHAHTTDIGAFNTGGESANHNHTVDLPNFTGSSGNGGFANTALNVVNPFLIVTFIIKA
jgi:microcystin-dependent protein